MNQQHIPKQAGLRTTSAATPGTGALADQFIREPELILACLQGVGTGRMVTAHRILKAALAALARKPNYADLNYYASYAAVSVDDLATAERLAEQAIEINPHYRAAAVQAARIALRRNDIERARHHLERAVEIGADYADVHTMLGNVWRRGGHAERARGAYERALRLNSNLAEARVALAALPENPDHGVRDELPA